MNKQVFRPFWSYDVKKTESWLSSMAEQGNRFVSLDRRTRRFRFQPDIPAAATYRIGYEKIKSSSLPKALIAEGWNKAGQSGRWSVMVNESPPEQLKNYPAREGVIQHNRMVMYILGGILFYFAIMALLFSGVIGLALFASDSKSTVVESPLWIITYLYMGAVAALLVLAVYSVITLRQTNRSLACEQMHTQVPRNVSPPERRLGKAEEKRLKRSGLMLVRRKFGWMYAPDKLERWLEAMEAQGSNLYRVDKSGTGFYFIKGLPRQMSYCADYQNTANDSYFGIHRDSGWKSCFSSPSSWQKWTLWSREYSMNEAKPEIYSDPSHHLKHARRVTITYAAVFVPFFFIQISNLGLRMELIFRSSITIFQITYIFVFILPVVIFGLFCLKIGLYYLRLRKRCKYSV